MAVVLWFGGVPRIAGPDLELARGVPWSAKGQPSEDWDRSCTGDCWVAPSRTETRSPVPVFHLYRGQDGPGLAGQGLLL